MTEQQAAELFREASESIEVVGSPYDAVVREARDRRRRTARTVAAAVVATACVVGLGSWVATRTTDDPAPAPGDVVAVRNPVDLAWYAGGVLHLRDVTVELPPMTDLVDVDDGAVYGDEEGTVAYVSVSGDRTVLGHKAPGSPTVVADAVNWVAWVEPGDDGGRLVLWNVPAHELVDDLPVAADARLIAIDQGRVHYESDGVELAWMPGMEPVEEARDGLLDVESTTRVYALATNGVLGRIDMVQGFFNVSFQRLGEGAMLSPGGVFALSREPGSYDDAFWPLLYDTRSGDLLPSGLQRGELALDAAFGNRTVSYLVTREDDLGSGSGLDGDAEPLVVLRTCDLPTSTCHDIIPLARPGEAPMLAH